MSRGTAAAGGIRHQAQGPRGRRRILVVVGVVVLALVTAGAVVLALSRLEGPTSADPTGATAVPGSTAAPSPTPSASVTTAPSPAAPSAVPAEPEATPAPAPAPEPVEPPVSAEGTPFDAQRAYEACVAAPDPWDGVVVTTEGELPPAPTSAVGPFEDSDVDMFVEGTWTVVIPVVREFVDGAEDGIKVCAVTGTVEAPTVSATDSLD